MQPDTDRIRHDIHDLREQTITLDALATRRIRVRHAGTHARMSSAPTPLNLPAADLLDQIHALARRLATAAGLRYGRSMDAHDLLKGLDRDQPCAALAARDDAWDIIRLIDDAAWHTRHLTEPDPSHRYIGICPQCGAGAWIPETQTTGDHRCHECGHIEAIADIAQAHELRLLTSGTVDTAAGLRLLLRACGITINASTMRSWIKRKRLTPVGTTDTGQPAYALADVLLLHRGLTGDRCNA